MKLYKEVVGRNQFMQTWMRL